MSLATELFGDQCIWWEPEDAVKYIRDSEAISPLDKGRVLRDWSAASNKPVTARHYAALQIPEKQAGGGDA